ncbi:glycosyltransferase family 4 protein [Metabacillus arenae]|uniref:Glycosyltransferase family 4 protein n=1 Tax=Metabacillus arenae TaxID=2771434 RepID=A0A926NIR0_9BACI|nr:glycosyltransferase family 4 protein [Metabacillus arenae]MBD1378867.1 glycosyltransferase family 4 protein [Metabacillus arenae]
MQNKVLFCATVDYHFKSFHLPILKWFKEQGWEVHVAAFGDMELPFVDRKFHIPIQRSPFKLKNMEAYQELKKIIGEQQYRMIHCHTPMGGVLTRLAAQSARKNGTKVIYTAHGFHFCMGSPIMNWLVYYPIEKMLSRNTDCLITINQEDYELAVNHHFKADRIEHVHGVGVDIDRFKPIDENNKHERRKKLGYNKNDFLLFYAAEFNKNKNQQFLIKAIAKMKEQVPHAKLLLAGEGQLLEECKKLALELGAEKMVHFLGYRNNIDEILPLCDAAVASSLREGLPVNIMEAMACGLPVVATKNRGHNELIQHHCSGWTVDNESIQEMVERLVLLAREPNLLTTFGQKGREIIESKYSVNNVINQKSFIYLEYMKEMEDFSWAAQ